VSDPVEVRRHVWESVVGMLRVYAHGAGLNGKEYVLTSDANGAMVKHQDSTLSVTFNADTGEGSWCVTHPEREECGAFRIEEDGTLTMPAGPKEIDHAAIDWLGYLTHDKLGHDKLIKNESIGTLAPALAPTINPS
jgi:hypothetical protein